ncbi:2-oxoacid:ferredoxin oxidoreductase subunit beta [Candidatus Dojkabacteria bacterium]|nr:2-oxoacid:ferredoxin oxidoreductase subunit beta [Candidatus Dojkabacteria bacterium]
MFDYYSDNIFTWCTNCGNYGIFSAVKRALVAEEIDPKDALLCFDIGCNGNGSDKISGYRFHGLHGRVLPFAAGASLANRKIKVIAFGGDGGTLSEGINHLVHSVRSNYDFTFILHNNENYGLTTGQASLTTRKGKPMNAAPDGVVVEPMNVMEFILGLKPSFAARAFSGDVKHMTEIIRAGIKHRGFSFIEILQNCTTYNAETPHEWYQERVYDISKLKGYNKADLESAKEVSKDLEENIATGVLYEDEDSVDFYSRLANRKGTQTELVDEVKNYEIGNFLSRFN